MVRIQQVSNEDAWSDASSNASDDSTQPTRPRSTEPLDAGAEQDDDDLLTLASYDPSSETLSDRFYALKDMVPPSNRARLCSSASTVNAWAWTLGTFGASAAWIACTSAILVGLPLMLAIEGEAGLVQQEMQYTGQQVRFFLAHSKRRSWRRRSSITVDPWN
ncbi:BQ2448_8133 [Microbotryum intermedium]|uniref:BQ2448_8133 protein n=1 Tax=Microbotryum intermedium TaxID=269621 RepID=A0A238FL40_9BASI|nr:BQ2448_8133 [Microbotryum intermedium]